MRSPRCPLGDCDSELQRCRRLLDCRGNLLMLTCVRGEGNADRLRKRCFCFYHEKNVLHAAS
eukprot:8439287-Pyramimonas_sp.AAC.1